MNFSGKNPFLIDSPYLFSQRKNFICFSPTFPLDPETVAGFHLKKSTPAVESWSTGCFCQIYIEFLISF